MHELALAVVAAAGGLEHGGQAQGGDGCVRGRAGLSTGVPGCGGHAGVAEEGLLGHAVLADAQHRWVPGRTGRSDCEEVEAAGAHVLELEGDDVDGVRRSVRRAAGSS